ncbi:GP46-like surface antigen, putative [Bodo saltans]|uniref:GP46-like surface antigen, putative n=1 Tax=Bodo saltans TaxID=75058 RepID=A0A0S4JEP2_BODSA|nr:GP46-like surface antigen, putative [Bodo saltans]|eukprot:CUG88591.1 GP46-like surface antigen, putative [Bodo saltans]
MGCIFTCTILLMAGTALSCSCAFRLPELQVFYDAMNGPQWQTKWDLSDPDAPCTFSGVICDGSDVTIINLAQQGLSGQLPAAIANLTKLIRFNVSLNSVTGTLPPDYAAWASISEFLVDSNSITGALPPEYSAWGRMSRFYCGRNNISGTLPVSYSNWSIIREFDVQYNRAKWHAANGVRQLDDHFILHAQQQSHFVHTSTAVQPVGCRYLFFSLQDCDIYGSLPPSYSKWTSVSTFTLKNSRISGTLPPEYGAWIGIRLFVISYSSLSGTIPSTYNHWPYVTTIDLSNNLITGTIPNNIWGSMASLNAIALWNNSLSGTIPPQLLQVPKLQYLSIGFNQLTGTIPPATSSLLFLIVQNNSELSGSLPASILLLSAFSLFRVPTAPRRCTAFLTKMMYELDEQKDISAVISYKAACPKSQPHEVLRSSTTVTREEVAPDTNWTRAFTLSSASLASSGVFTTMAVAQSFLVSGTSALSGGTHGTQAALMARRKRALCQLSATRTIADSSGFPDLNQFTTDNDPSLLCCDAITSPTQLESIASLSPLIGALLGNTALVVIFCLIKYSLPFAVRYWCSPSSSTS